MKAPNKPKKPVKPLYPNEDVKVVRHEVNATNLFFDRSEFDDDNEDDCEYDHLTHGTIVNPSIADLIKLVPSGIGFDNIFIDLDVGYEGHSRHVERPLYSVGVSYTTPINFNEEIKKYNKNCIQYEIDLLNYKKNIISWEKEMIEYKKQKEINNIDKKKSKLKEELAKLESIK